MKKAHQVITYLNSLELNICKSCTQYGICYLEIQTIYIWTMLLMQKNMDSYSKNKRCPSLVIKDTKTKEQDTTSYPLGELESKINNVGMDV